MDGNQLQMTSALNIYTQGSIQSITAHLFVDIGSELLLYCVLWLLTCEVNGNMNIASWTVKY